MDMFAMSYLAYSVWYAQYRNSCFYTVVYDSGEIIAYYIYQVTERLIYDIRAPLAQKM